MARLKRKTPAPGYQAESITDFTGAPTGFEPSVTALRRLCPGPLDEGSVWLGGRLQERGIIGGCVQCSSRKPRIELFLAHPVAPAAKPRVIPRAEHTLSRSHISPSALRVLYRLKDAGFRGFWWAAACGTSCSGHGAQAISTSLRTLLPEQVKPFTNCRLVGRRFRLAHVFFGQEIIEVATFRAATAPSQGEEPLADADPEDGEAPELDEDPEIPAEGAGDPGEEASGEAEAAPVGAFGRQARPSLGDDSERKFDATGRILRDNVYGTIDEDVWRRDFTANSLYYNIADFSIWDYCSGVEDIAARRLRLIGDPETRFREDPVRMLRAARFEAKLGFEIDPATAEPIGQLRELLGGVPPARLFDEMLKLFLTGHGAKSLEVLRRREWRSSCPTWIPISAHTRAASSSSCC